jgi:hypothetical protein
LLPYANPQDAHAAEQHIVPHLKALVDDPEVKQQRARWDWDLFEPHNELWKSTVARLMRDRDQRKQNGVDAKKLGARWVYVDLWDQALQRPDAHSDPVVDCLHCKPAFSEALGWSLYEADVPFLQGVCLPSLTSGQTIFIIFSF